MAFLKKEWKNREAEYPTRRLLTPTGTANTYDVSRAEGVVVEPGNAFDAANMNDLESRIESADAAATAAAAEAQATATAAHDVASAAMPKAGGAFTGTTSGPTTTSPAAIFRNIQMGTADLTPGSSALSSGQIYLVYE
ncbi:hypothetical protein LJC60_10510 [Ruminococcaceae bacterium OttesenSCG-928-D13]|nr:hypothetical protein [Ruminococcaceae bacterium OttesenSCG-928-D13]